MNRRMPKLVVRINAGLGNQLFNYAVAWLLAQRLGRQLEIDTSEYVINSARRYLLDRFDAPKHTPRTCGLAAFVFLVARLLQRLGDPVIHLFLQCLRIKWLHFRDADDLAAAFAQGAFETNAPTLYLSGCYWGRLDLLPDRSTLRKMFGPLSGASVPDAEESVSIHVRRGDFASLNWQLTEGYYQRALSEMAQRVNAATWYVFSDDPAWCQAHLPHLPKMVFVELSEDPAEDLMRMASCRHHIVANSSFSWWAAYLSDEKGLTICPRDYLYKFPAIKGLNVPSAWIVLAPPAEPGVAYRGKKPTPAARREIAIRAVAF